MSSSQAAQILTPTEFTKEEVMQLILKMKKYNQREYATVVYVRENERKPEWELRAAFLALKAGA